MAWGDLIYGVYTLGQFADVKDMGGGRQLRTTPILGTDKAKVRNLGGFTFTLQAIIRNTTPNDLKGKFDWVENIRQQLAVGGKELKQEMKDGTFKVWAHAYNSSIATNRLHQNLGEITLTFLVDDFPKLEE